MTKQVFIEPIGLEGEEWRDVVGYESLYAISNCGRVKKKACLIGKGSRGTHWVKEHILIEHFSNSRPFVFLTRDNNGRRKFVEELVADAFLPNPNKYRFLLHLNGDIKDCSLSNIVRTDCLIPSEPNEEWRDVVGYEGLYKVSSHGRVFSLISDARGPRIKRRISQRLLTLQECIRNGKHYYCVSLTKDGITRARYLHRIIAEAFLPNPNNLKEVDHWDRDGLNNDISNLRWCTHKENQNNPNTREQMSMSFNPKGMESRYTPVVQLHEGQLIRAYPSVSNTREHGFLPSGVSNVLRGKSKSHRGFQWMYLSDYENLVSMSKNS